MKILYFVPSLRTVASVRVAYDTAAGLQQLGHTVHMAHIDVLKKDVFNPNFPTYLICDLKDKLTEYDIIHCHGYRPDILTNRYLRNSKKRPIVVSTLHMYTDIQLKNDYGIIKAYLGTKHWLSNLKNRDQVICLSKDSKKYHKKLLPNTPISVVHNGRDVNFTNYPETPRWITEKRKSGKIVLGLVARLVKQKNVDFAFYFLKENPNYVLYIVGNGSEQEHLKNLSKKLNIENQIYFHGYQQNGHVYNKFFDYAIFPSTFEGFPLALIEATLHACPCLVSNIPSFSEFYTNNEIGFFNLDNPNSIGIAAQNYKPEMAENARFKSLEQYSTYEMSLRHQSLYQSLLKKHNQVGKHSDEKHQVQLLISTMFLNEKSNLLNYLSTLEQHSLIINQTKAPYTSKASDNIKIVNMEDFGLSKSRNEAIKQSNNQCIGLICDDDTRFHERMQATVREAFTLIPEADIVTFQILRNEQELYKKYDRKIYKHDKYTIWRVSSIEIALKVKNIKEKNIRFDTNFGLGSPNPTNEETLFLYEAIKSGLKIYYYPKPIVYHEDESQGAELTNKNLITKGMAMKLVFGYLSVPIAIGFSIKKSIQHQNNPFRILKKLLEGIFA